MGFPPPGIEKLTPVLRQHGHQVRMFDTCHPKMKEQDIVQALREDPTYYLSNPDPKAGADAYIEMILWEEAQNHAELKPEAKHLFEIRCRERMIQSISSIL